TSDAARAVRIWDGSTPALCQTLSARSAPLSLLTFSPGGDRLAGGAERRIELFHFSGEQKTEYPRRPPAPTVLSGFRRNWNSLALGPGGATLAEIGDATQVRVWDARSLRLCLGVNPPLCFHAVALSPDGRWLAAGGEDGQAYLWDATSGKLAATLEYEE